MAKGRNQDGLGRMGHLFESAFLAAESAYNNNNDNDSDKSEPKGDLIRLSQHYGKVMLEVSRKLVIRM